MVRPKILFTVLCVGLLIVGSAVSLKLGFLKQIFSKPLPPSNEVAVDADREKLSRLAASFPGDIIFDSNRSGTFGIYRFHLDSATTSTVVNSEQQDMYPDVAPGGSLIVFARAKTTDRRSPADIWLVDPDGSNERLLAKDGTFPTFSGDGTTVYFERGRKKLISVSLDGTNEQEVFPKGNKDFGSYGVIKPQVSPDDTYVAFISDKKGRWNTWYANLKTGELKHLHEGCEPSWFPSANELVWIKTAGALDGSGLYRYELGSGAVSELQDAGPPRGHEYFPRISPDGRFLLYSSCREGEHSHLTANYQLFAKDLSDNTLTRITFDQHTNRWPKVIPRAQ